MNPDAAPDKFRLRDIEQRLAADLHAAVGRVRRATTEQERAKAAEAHLRALQRFTDFAAKGIIPPDLHVEGELN